MKRFFTGIILTIFVCVWGNSQTFEIRTVNAGGGVIRVEMRETGGTTPSTANFVTDLVFGIKWSSSYGVDLGSVDNTAGYNIVKSGSRTTSGSFHFQAFGANATPFNFPSNWTVNTWTEIMNIPNTLNGSSTGTFEIAEVGFDVTTDPNIGVDLTDYTPTINGTASGVPLPVELISFTAAPTQKNILLTWSSATEENFSGYELQRSSDGVDFGKVAWVAGKGGVEQASYSYIDESIVYNKNYYYRLKMVDSDNEFEYSPVRTAMVEGGEGVVSVFPNPAGRNDQITIENTYDERVRFVLFKASGKAMKDIFIEPKSTVFFDLKNKTSGLLTYKIETSQKLMTGKLVIQ